MEETFLDRFKRGTYTMVNVSIRIANVTESMSFLSAIQSAVRHMPHSVHQTQEKEEIYRYKIAWGVVGLATISQSTIVGVWSYQTLQGSLHAVGFAFYLLIGFAIVAGLALDVGVVYSATGGLKPAPWKIDLRKGHTTVSLGGWAAWTPFVAFLFSSAIAYDLFAAGDYSTFHPRALLHIGWPLFVLASSKYAAALMRQELDAKNHPVVEPDITPTLITTIQSELAHLQQEVIELRDQAPQLITIPQPTIAPTSHREQLIIGNKSQKLRLFFESFAKTYGRDPENSDIEAALEWTRTDPGYKTIASKIRRIRQTSA